MILLPACTVGAGIIGGLGINPPGTAAGGG